MQSTTTNQRLYEGKPRQVFTKFAVPQMIGLLFNSVYLIVDGIFIGNRLGREAMAAAAVAVPFIEILIAVAMAVASGAGIIISGKLGRGEAASARKTFGLAISVMGIIGVAIALCGNLFIDGLATTLGSTPAIHEEAVTYLWYIITFAPFLLYSFLLGGLARNDGKPNLAMAALAAGSILNIVLDYVFMYPLNMGIAGAALATALGPIFSVGLLLPHFLRKKGHLYFTRFTIRFAKIREIFVLGFPSFIMEFTIGIITFIYNLAITRTGYGELGLAAYLLIGYLMLIILTIFLGLAEGLQPVFSYYTGSGEKEKSRRLLAFAAKVFLALGIVLYGLILLFGSKFLQIFAPGDPELIAFTAGKCALYFCAFFAAGLNILMISYWQSTRMTGQALVISLLRSLILPPVLIFALTSIFGREALWFCHSASELLTAGVAVYLLVSLAKRAPLALGQKTSS